MGIQEQEEELEALSFIFPEEFQLLSSNSCQVRITWDFIQEIPNSLAMELVLKVDFPVDYPDSSLNFSLINPKEILDVDLEILELNIQEKMNEFIGLAMVFNIIEFIKVDLVEIIKSRISLGLSLASKVDQEIKQRIGTKVTKETFEKWKSDFSNEIVQILAAKSTLSGAQKDFAMIHKLLVKEKQVTGRQLFEKDSSLALGDLKLVDVSEDVAVDLSLFKGLPIEELSLEDEFDWTSTEVI